MADEILLCGADVRPRKLQQSGFVFEHPDLEDALRSELGRVP
jgi:NAD dependent epimerase/dehydratase family enzyme